MAISFRRRLAGHFAACTLVLAAPFLVFVQANYTIFSAETLLVLACLAMIGAPFAVLASCRPALCPCAAYASLLAVFIEVKVEQFHFTALSIVALYASAFVLLLPLRRHLAPLLTAIFAAFNLATIGMALAEKTDASATVVGRAEGASDLPAIVHLVLDEQVGLDALGSDIPGGEELRASLLGFLESEGFAVFGRAYALYDMTKDSIPSALSLGMRDSPSGLTSGKEPRLVLEENEYFKALKQKGYSIRVYQSYYLDYCNTPEISVAHCYTYGLNRPSGVEWIKLDTFRRALVLARMYAGPTFTFELAWRAFVGLRSVLHPDVSPPEWWRRDLHRGSSPITAVAAFDTLIADLGNAKRGTLYFAHILLPHHPYVLDRDCEIRDPIIAWGQPSASTPQDRRDRYGEYCDQMRCAMRKLKEVLDRMKTMDVFEDSMVVVHGDHGSRIGPWNAVTFQNLDSLTRQNHLDTFSTLFAIRAPGFQRGYDPRPSSLPSLLRGFAMGSVDHVDREPEPFVYLREPLPGRGDGWRRVPFAGFPDASP